MKIKDYKCKCGCNDFFFADKGNQKGIYCTKCGKWLKWADKNEKNLVHCQYTDEEIAKSFIEDVEAVKDHLPCGQMMEFPKTFDEFAEDYGFKDKDEIYTNGSELITVFRVKQWLEHISTIKNNLGVDCIDRTELLKAMDTWDKFGNDPNKGLIPLRTPALQDRYVPYVKYDDMVNCVKGIPPVTPQEPRWIPVSEKLPNDRDWYLGIFKEPDTGWINPLPFICDYVGRETKATTKEYWILRGFTDIDEPCDYYLNLECVEWMPLPKSYKGAEE